MKVGLGRREGRGVTGFERVLGGVMGSSEDSADAGFEACGSVEGAHGASGGVERGALMFLLRYGVVFRKSLAWASLHGGLRCAGEASYC